MYYGRWPFLCVSSSLASTSNKQRERSKAEGRREASFAFSRYSMPGRIQSTMSLIFFVGGADGFLSLFARIFSAKKQNDENFDGRQMDVPDSPPTRSSVRLSSSRATAEKNERRGDKLIKRGERPPNQ